MTEIGFMAKPSKPEVEKPRVQKVRRELNNNFYGFHDNEGNFSWSKFIAVWGQIACLFHFGRSFDELIKTPESLVIVLAFVISPDLFRMFIKLKWGAK